ncbi:uncharacterized protein LOC123202235 [Mangifera indica]|uniref:uncharacterized protein LOC123202235 n=1 Tax=Mangifera indica TaxID=29780 RepID=UPI001CFB075F|nr:uncharacterized protein LOC123202235 [Mangifera indica]
MGLLRSLAMLVLMIWFCFSLDVMAQSSTSRPARALDALLQDYAYSSFVRPKTGLTYDGRLPSNLSGIQVAGMRLRSGSLRNRGVQMYKEFHIPVGVTVQPYVERLVLVYQNLGNRSSTYYPLTNYTYLAPVLGLLAYDAFDLLATNLPELNITASADPISIRFQDIMSEAPQGSVPKCVWFDLHGLTNFSNVVSGNSCLTVQQGHFSIVVESTTPSPSPVSPIPPPPSGKGKKSKSRVWIIVGSVLGGIVLLGLLAFLIIWLQKYKHRKKMQQMEKAADVGEALQMTTVGDTKAPTALVTRTQPTLETEYVP